MRVLDGNPVRPVGEKRRALGCCERRGEVRILPGDGCFGAHAIL